MSETLAIIDYGMGNLRSVQKAFQRIGKNAIITSTPADLYSAHKIILPGVGAFKDAMFELDKRNLIEPIRKNIQSGKLFLGICLGLQLLFSKSFEDGEHKGLNILTGNVIKFSNENIHKPERKLKIPHMGWNKVKFPCQGVPLLENIPDESYMYFVHSYYVCPEQNDIIIGKTDYGINFTSMVWKDNVFATQFHPEKSQQTGLDILRNFTEMKC
ncbi:MAG: imidazole glycerol phosphate synthase subunit HisH [Candidatus Anammoxibacter sp.]